MLEAWIQFRRAPGPVHILAASAVAVAMVTVVSSLFSPGVAFLLIAGVVIAGSGLTGVSARTMGDGFAGGFMLSWGGFFLGYLIFVPVTAALQGASFLVVGFAVLVGFVFGLLFGAFFAVLGGSVGYIAARLAKKPKWSLVNVGLPPKSP